MLLAKKDGFILECSDPTYANGVHRAWFSNKHGNIRGHGKADTLLGAVHAAIADLDKLQWTTYEQRMVRELARLAAGKIAGLSMPADVREAYERDLFESHLENLT